jgi:hypothetical protein
MVYLPDIVFSYLVSAIISCEDSLFTSDYLSAASGILPSGEIEPPPPPPTRDEVIIIHIEMDRLAFLVRPG